MLLRRALQGDWVVRVKAIPETSYEAHAWWSSSEGTRVVISEAFAYLHALAQAGRPAVHSDAVACGSLGHPAQVLSVR